ncbi:uncharacterized protein LOC108106448 isoform X2 [Drosophila eugracilis]|uniref:uncharacterized protein LOC108106448 isoform X2 n=1 Tax=Drosophila eugracilis TaxID=29029 RepID=UPI0007E67FD2|nr:uncharacterized protein LOC108106448 isoform X2 [Drosophila eugracilis]
MANSGVLSLVKKVVFSLIVSSPERMTIEQLIHDYRSEEGCNIPYSDLGFKDAESFLRSIPDTVRVIGLGTKATITVISTEKSEHIQKLVHGQKKSSNRSKNKPKTPTYNSAHFQKTVNCQKKSSNPSKNHPKPNHKPRYCHPSERSDLVFKNESVQKMNTRNLPLRSYQRPTNQQCPALYSNYNRPMYSFQTASGYANSNVIWAAQQQVLYNYYQQQCYQYILSLINQYGYPQNDPNPQWQTFRQKPKPSKNNSQAQIGAKPKPQKYRNHHLIKDSTHQTINSQARIGPNPKPRKDEPKKDSTPQTITEAKQGKPLKKLRSAAKELMKTSESLSLEAVPPLSKGKLDCKVSKSYEKQQETLPAIEIQNSTEKDEAVAHPELNLLTKSTIQEDIPKTQELKEPFFGYESSEDGDGDNAIPAYAVDHRVLAVDYPKDSVRFDFKLPNRDIEAVVKLMQRVEVQLVNVDNPHKFNFWVYDESFNEYKALSSNMQFFYDSHDSEKYSIPLCLISTDHLCAVRCSNSGIWERAKVVRYRPISICNPIEVELIDTGVIICVSAKNIKFLLKEFALLPPQYLSGRLAFITQCRGSVWSAGAIDLFYKMVAYRRLYAQVEAFKNNTAYIVLVDPDSKAAFMNLNKSLIDCGLVRRCITA